MVSTDRGFLCQNSKLVQNDKNEWQETKNLGLQKQNHPRIRHKKIETFFPRTFF